MIKTVEKKLPQVNKRDDNLKDFFDLGHHKVFGKDSMWMHLQIYQTSISKNNFHDVESVCSNHK